MMQNCQYHFDLHALPTVRRKEEVREVSLVEGRVWGWP